MLCVFLCLYFFLFFPFDSFSLSFSPSLRLSPLSPPSDGRHGPCFMLEFFVQWKYHLESDLNIRLISVANCASNFFFFFFDFRYHLSPFPLFIGTFNHLVSYRFFSRSYFMFGSNLSVLHSNTHVTTHFAH